MGQVLTWDAIQAGRIPKKESFHQVAAPLREVLSVEPSVVSALLFGSVVRGDFNIRSDIDCVVIYETEQQTWAMNAMHEVGRAAHALHVPINFAPCDTVVAKTHLHHFGGEFIRHLQASMDTGGLIKGNLVDLLAPTIPAKQEIESYLRVKMYNMTRSLAEMVSFSEERMAAFLKKALEASTHVARKMLIYEGNMRGDSKRDVRERYRETMPSALSRQFDHLLAMDSMYSTHLRLQVDQPDQGSYLEALGRLQAELPRVLEFLRSNILRLDAVR